MLLRIGDALCFHIYAGKRKRDIPFLQHLAHGDQIISATTADLRYCQFFIRALQLISKIPNPFSGNVVPAKQGIYGVQFFQIDLHISKRDVISIQQLFLV